MKATINLFQEILIIILLGMIAAQIALSYNYYVNINNKLDTMNVEYIEYKEVCEIFNKTIQRKDKVNGVYFHSGFMIARLKGRTSEAVYKTVSHELAHYDIKTDKEKIKVNTFIESDYPHFCNREKQTNWNLEKGKCEK